MSLPALCTAVGPGLLGIGMVGEVLERNLEPLRPSVPDSGRAWDCAEHRRSCLGLSGARPARQPPMARTPRCSAEVSTFASGLGVE